MGDTFATIDEKARVDLKVEDSRFIAEAYPIATEEEAEMQIESVRKREHGAAHHCTAYRIGTSEDVFRYNDDGEPSGTAGPPILKQIDARGLTDTLVVVTRYFGGTKLGTGGLVRAYGDAAAAALEAAPVVEKVRRQAVQLRFDYDDTTPAEQALRQFDVEVQERTYSEVTELVVGVPRSDVDAFLSAFTNALGGRGEATPIN